MKKATLFLVLYLTALLCPAQVREAEVRSTISANLPTNLFRAITEESLRQTLYTITDYAAQRPPYLTMAQVRANKADTASVVYITDAGKEGTFRYQSGSTATDDAGMVVVVTSNNRRYQRVTDGLTARPEWWGATGNGITDDTQALRSAIKNGKLVLITKSYRITDTLNLRPGQTLTGGGTIDLVFGSAKKGGINASSHCIIDGITINQKSTNSSIASGQDNVCILVGYYTFQTSTPTNVVIRNCKLNMYSTAPSLTLNILGANNVLVENCVMRNYSSATTASGSHWAMLTSTPSEGTIHPYNITYRGCTFMNYGVTDNTTTAGVLWIAASHNITVESCRFVGAGSSAIYGFAGDYGYYYAPPEQQKYAFRNIVIRNVVAEQLPKAGINIIGKAVLAPGTPVYDMDVLIENSAFRNDSSANTSNGITIASVRGVRIRNTTLDNFYVGVYPQTNTKNIVLQGLKIRNSHWKGVYINDNTAPPEDVAVLNCTIENSGTASPTSGAGVELGNCVRPVVSGNVFGLESGPDATTWGVRVATQANPVAAIIENNFVRNLRSGGVGFSIGNSADTGLVYKLDGNRVGSGITFRGGSTSITIDRN